VGQPILAAASFQEAKMVKCLVPDDRRSDASNARLGELRSPIRLERRMQPGLAAPQEVLTGVSTNKSVDGSTSEIFRLQT